MPVLSLLWQPMFSIDGDSGIQRLSAESKGLHSGRRIHVSESLEERAQDSTEALDIVCKFVVLGYLDTILISLAEVCSCFGERFS